MIWSDPFNLSDDALQMRRAVAWHGTGTYRDLIEILPNHECTGACELSGWEGAGMNWFPLAYDETTKGIQK